jgi:cytochrome c peroxidase
MLAPPATGIRYLRMCACCPQHHGKDETNQHDACQRSLRRNGSAGRERTAALGAQLYHDTSLRSSRRGWCSRVHAASLPYTTELSGYRSFWLLRQCSCCSFVKKLMDVARFWLRVGRAQELPDARARWRLRQRIASRWVLPSDGLRAMNSIVF